MSVEKWWNEIDGRGKREKPREKPTQTPFRPPRNPHGVTEMQTRDPSGGRRASNCLRHETSLIMGQDYFLLQIVCSCIMTLEHFMGGSSLTSPGKPPMEHLLNCEELKLIEDVLGSKKENDFVVKSRVLDTHTKKFHQFLFIFHNNSYEILTSIIQGEYCLSCFAIDVFL